MKVLAIFILLFVTKLSNAFPLQPTTASLCKIADNAGVKNVLIGSFLTTTGDIISQSIDVQRSKSTSEEKKYSVVRSLQWAIFGVFVNGMFLSWWFKSLAGWIPLRQGNFLDVIKKVAVNQLFLAPGINSLIFLFSIWTTKDALNLPEKLKVFIAKCRRDLPNTMKQSTMFWGSVQVCNFSLCPLEYHVMVTNIASIFWGTYVNLVSYRKVA